MNAQERIRMVSDEIFRLTIIIERLNMLIEDMSSDYFYKENVSTNNEDDRVLLFTGYKNNCIKCDMAFDYMSNVIRAINNIQEMLKEAVIAGWYAPLILYP